MSAGKALRPETCTLVVSAQDHNAQFYLYLICLSRLHKTNTILHALLTLCGRDILRCIFPTKPAVHRL